MRIKDVQEILQKLKNGKVTQNDIARAIETSRANVSKLIKNNSFINDEKLSKIEKYFNIKFDDKKNEIWIDYYPNSVIELQNGEIKLSDRHAKVKIPSSFFNIQNNMKYLMCHANDNSMYPLIIKGDFVIIEKEQNDINNGKIYMFIYDKTVYIRRLTKNINEILIEAENKDYKIQSIEKNNFENFSVIGRVVNVIRNAKDF